MQQLRVFSRFLLVTVGIVIFTSFTIDATDTLQGSQTALSILAQKITEKTCPVEMVLVQYGEQRFCIDRFEAGVGKGCVITDPTSAKDTALNVADADCLVSSVAGVRPWTFVARPQAVALCAKMGKRLPTTLEWYRAALGTPDNVSSCNLDSVLALTGTFAACRSGVGALDLVGNVWELIDGTVEDAMLFGRSLPVEGYVSEVDEAGIALRTSLIPNAVFNEDYFWTESFGRYVLMRGGFYGSRADGGVYAVHAKTEPDFASNAVGFRCVKDL